MKFFCPLLAGGLLLAAAPHVHAQTPAEPPAKAPEKEQGRHIRGLSFRLKTPLKEAFVFAPKIMGTRLEVKDYLNDEAGILPLDGGTDLVLTNSADPASVKDPEALLAKVKIPADLKSAVFIFLPGTGKEGDPKYRVLVMEDGTAGFPAGALKVTNLSPVPVRVRLEKEDFDFKSGEVRVIKNPPMGANMHAALTVSAFRDQKWQVFGNSTMPAPGRARVFQIFYDNGGKVEMQGIRDVAFDRGEP